MNLQDLPQEMLNIIYEHITDKRFVILTTVNKFFNQQKQYKKLLNLYNIMNIKHIIHKFNFTKITYNHTNQLTNYIPRTLTHMFLENDIIVNKLPEHIKCFHIKNLTDKLQKCLPDNLEELTIAKRLKEDCIIKKFPNNLKYLKLLPQYSIECQFPESLTILDTTYKNVMNTPLPKNLTNLSLHFHYGIDRDGNIQPINLPEKLKFLHIYTPYVNNFALSNYIASLPDNLETFCINGKCDLDFPKNLQVLKTANQVCCRETLHISDVNEVYSKLTYHQPTCCHETLQILELSKVFDKLTHFPPNLQKLYINECKSDIFDKLTSFPLSLKFLSLPSNFNGTIDHLLNPNIKVVYKTPLVKQKYYKITMNNFNL